MSWGLAIHRLQNPSSYTADAGWWTQQTQPLSSGSIQSSSINYLITNMPSAVKEDTQSVLGGIKGICVCEMKLVRSTHLALGMWWGAKPNIRKQNLASAILQTTSCAHLQKTNWCTWEMPIWLQERISSENDLKQFWLWIAKIKVSVI